MNDIGALIREINRAWVDGRFEDLKQYFHKEVVMLMPGSPQALQGVESMVASYREFCAMATVYGFEIKNVMLFPFRDVVMCHARFAVDYEIPSGRFQEEGMEIYAVDPKGQAPKILWRSQMALKEPGS